MQASTKLKVIVFSVVIITFGLALILAEAKRSTAQQVIDLVHAAQEYLREESLPKALIEFNNGASAFHVSPTYGPDILYIFVLDYNGNVKSFGNSQRLVGFNLWNLKDAQGRLFIQEIIAECRSQKDDGWIEYKWLNKFTNALESRYSYVEQVPKYDLCVGTGILINPPPSV